MVVGIFTALDSDGDRRRVFGLVSVGNEAPKNEAAFRGRGSAEIVARKSSSNAP